MFFHKNDAPATNVKQELQKKEEPTQAGKYYSPRTDIVESKENLTMVMDMPGVVKEEVTIKLEKNVLSIEGRIQPQTLEKLEPVYTEYNVGHFLREFTLSNSILQEGIKASMRDGVLTVTLPKVVEAAPRQITIN